ncbi:class I SAM-dependent methyltransferase [Paralimibaculum aggregatum]|uniref:Class I SAM-dependent methyltransferase n=1 Tax=Paralimibaculum aggregatum TaxID=3036245 RepID=A0ABQ6LLW1_9RHOB|nr:methyltransferase domain-containing protein [Limibaculum sp. NKW23]GMG83285.1 class I SAM-dependent methyltransferase [Limibaculum sp. NKW23]
MDVERVSAAEMDRCLRDIEWLDGLVRGHRPTLAWLDRVAGDRRRLAIADIGAGRGAMLRRIAAWGRARGIALELTGIDINPAATAAARAATPAADGIRYLAANVFDWEPERPVDLVISALLAHHLDDGDLVRFLRWQERQARIGWFINDLHRHPVPAGFAGLVTRLVPLHRFVRHDAPLSVRRAFRRKDFQVLGRAAGLAPDALEIGWWFPYRWGIGRRLPD